jgi:3-hydroxyisobutyrate dehydrogenase-like beta-hydroxyacid dehydrogenase
MSSTSNASSAALPRVGVLGLGIMGSAISKNLLKAGFPVVGHDPDAAAVDGFKSHGGSFAKNAEAVAREADVLLLCLPSEAALAASAEGIAAAARRGQVVAETSTLPIEAKTAALERLKAAGVTLLDCPLSGTGAQAARRDLAVYASGDAAAIDRMQSTFDGFARVTYRVGDFGNGMRMKLMANLLVAIHNISTAEALLMGQRMGIAIDTAVKVLADGAGGSRMLEVRGPVMSARSWDDAAMKVHIWQKDMKLIAAALAEHNVPAPIFSAAIPVYNAAMGMGLGDADTAAVFEVLDRMSSPPR